MPFPLELAPVSPIKTILALNIPVHTIQNVQTAYGRDESRPLSSRASSLLRHTPCPDRTTRSPCPEHQQPQLYCKNRKRTSCTYTDIDRIRVF